MRKKHSKKKKAKTKKHHSEIKNFHETKMHEQNKGVESPMLINNIVDDEEFGPLQDDFQSIKIEETVGCITNMLNTFWGRFWKSGTQNKLEGRLLQQTEALEDALDREIERIDQRETAAETLLADLQVIEERLLRENAEKKATIKSLQGDYQLISSDDEEDSEAVWDELESRVEIESPVSRLSSSVEQSRSPALTLPVSSSNFFPSSESLVSESKRIRALREINERGEQVLEESQRVGEQMENIIEDAVTVVRRNTLT
jgi:hypothetical protein